MFECIVKSIHYHYQKQQSFLSNFFHFLSDYRLFTFDDISCVADTAVIHQTRNRIDSSTFVIPIRA